ncbi:helix-turn-helix domain-containing protein [Prochlorococcus marinus]|uniref:helix-turn-helix domain-containing protein n=1 Tax=Prochlorococcus marinus TaxID=1219 RepID=UPI00214B657A|nr:helix-turn-helix domain-containing protein [Prochlorococcus marinus]
MRLFNFLPKKLSDIQKLEILESFKEGSEIAQIAKKYNFSNATIVRQLKKMMGDDGYDNFKKKNLSDNLNVLENPPITSSKVESENIFFEVIPLTEGVELNSQKDLSSRPIKDFEFPNTVYMIVDKGIELETKLLKEYPEWQFLPKDDLNRKTIQVYFDLKNAKRDCNKEQKVIKVPNTDVFKIVSPILLSRGITRIITEDQLIAL